MDKGAFENLLQPELEKAYRYALRLVSGNADEAADLLQDATLAAFKGREGFKLGTNFRAWFFKILTNEFYRTRTRKQVQTVDIADVQDAYLYVNAAQAGVHLEGADPARELFDSIEAEHVKKALESLPEEFRMACMLFFLGDMSYEEIAATLDIPVGTVRSRLHRGRKALQAELWEFAKARGIVGGGAHV
ncbi:MAG: sigma-70 family RNA polymerase sigma factor [Fimbriimonadaceae bacterium]|nr:sigma-70 family RNA polymerase sigma factor [Fimbriimonadaceae bacterium]